MQRELLYFVVLYLFGLLLRPALSQTVNGSDNINGSNSSDVMVVIDYDSSGGSGGSGISPTQEPLGCMLPEDRVSPSTVNGAEQYLRRRALCHALCVGEQVTFDRLPNREVLTGYPVWNVIPDSVLLERAGNLNCRVFSYHEIVECERGCLMGTSISDTECTSTCFGECFMECGCGASETSCNCGRLPTQLCGLDCREGQCRSGCRTRNRLNQVYPPDAKPDTPPLLNQSDQFPTQYCVDVTPPRSILRELVATLLFRVEDIATDSRSYYWTRQLKLDLQAFGNRVVNVSYAVATTRGISDYSPATTVQVPEGTSSRSFPEQLSNFTVSVPEPDEREGFYQHHTIEISWERPDDYENITSYTITLARAVENAACGDTDIFTAEPNATSLTLQARDASSPPFSSCGYSITVQVDPMRPGDIPASLGRLDVPAYPTPIIEAECPRSFSRMNRSYIINFTWSVLPSSDAVLSAVNASRVRLRLQGTTMNIGEYPILPNAPRAVLIRADPLVGTQANGRYEVIVIVAFNRIHLEFGIEILGNCRVDPVPAPPPDPITDLNVTEESFFENYEGPRTVFVTVNFTWTEPFVPFGSLRNYDVWLDRMRLLPNQNPDSLPRTIPAPASSASLTAPFTTTEQSFIVYLQLRPRSVHDMVSNWSTPIEINVTIFDPPPPDVMRDIRVSNISGIVVGSPQVRVTGGMLWTAPNITFGDLTQYHLWIGDRPVEPNDVFRTFQVTRTSFSINQDFPLQSGSADVFIQMRAVSQFNRQGDWSDPMQILRIRLPPPPRNITAAISEVPSVATAANEMLRVSGEVMLEWLQEVWSGVARYESRVGLTVLDLYESAPASELNSYEVMNGTGSGVDAFEVETESVDNLTVVVQMRAVNQFNRQGNWSDAIQIRVRLPPPPVDITASISGVPSVQLIANAMLRVSGEVMLQWSPPDDPTEEGVTGYESRVAMAVLTQFQNAPTSELNSFEVMDRAGVDPFVVEVESVVNLAVVVQMRSTGNGGYGPWSDNLVLPVVSPPPPRIITAAISGVPSIVTITNEMVRVSGEVTLEWSPPDDPTEGGVTRYESRVGLAALSQFENPSTTQLHSFEVMARTGVDPFVVETSSADNLVVVVQMRSSGNEGYGPWSDPNMVPIMSPPPPRNITATISGVPSVVTIADEMVRVSGEVMLEWSPPDDPTEGGVTRYESRVGLTALSRFENPPTSELSFFEVVNGTGVDPFVFETESVDNLTLVVQMRSSGSGPSVSGRKRRQTSMGSGPWSDPMFLPVVIPPGSLLPAILGSTLAVAAIILIALLVLLIFLCFICIKSWLFKRKLEREPENLVMLGRGSRTPTYIPLAKIEGKEPLLDFWEIPAADVIVEDRLGEGAFGEVFRGTIKGPLRNPKISSVLKHSIGVPIAIKLLKPTASGKEKADFLAEIDMMKKIAEGYNPHIVNMVGCVTLQEPLCLITEFVPFGDLLSFLRSNRKKVARMRRRKKITQAQVEEQLQLEHVILEHAKVEQSEVQQLILEQAQGEQGQVEQGQEGQVDGIDEPMQEDGAAASTSPAPYLESRNEYSHLTTQLNEAEVAEQSEPTQDDTPAPYVEARNEYSKLDPKTAEVVEEEEEDAYPDLGDLEADDLIQFAYQIATGMEYLASLNIIHRDLACRNILLGEDKKLKITDFGMSREVEEVYVKKTKGRLPLKWMAIESIVSREFTTASDVWAYGVTLWEIGTLGGFPYPTVPNQELLLMLSQGYRLEKPDNCAPEVYEIMLECWNEDPEDRPTFSQLRTKFGSLILAGKGDLYIDLEVDEMKPYYLIKEEEEKKEGSSSSSGSEASIASVEEIKEKKREREELKAKPSNPYVEAPAQPIPSTASIRRPPESIVEEERDAREQTEPEESPYPDQLPSRPIPRPGNQAAPPLVAERPAQNAAINGVPISMLHSDQTSTPESEPTTDGQRTNPYVDDPSTRQSLIASTPTVETNGSLPSLNNVHLEKISGKQSTGTTAVVMTEL